ncbi:GNAT family N-acetyltransferase [Rossellomorea sp. NPDC077527]|uniref:GNAT family N-acetyltransferase n=1 Tax=Rossellomorea sp. NPDC077527 TaxID=3364510 RepID=UPI0037C95D80
MHIHKRPEQPEDYLQIEEVVKSAFSQEKLSDQTEHLLIHRIRKSDAYIPDLSLVATDQNNQPIGHLLLSKVTIVHQGQEVDSLALAPVSVAPEHQKKGIGSQLITEALTRAKEMGYQSVIVLGHEHYYPKFGFKPASSWNIRAPFDVPDHVFMATELTENALHDVQGVVHYSEAFSS